MVKNRRGSLMALTIILFAIINVLGTAILSLSVNESKQAINHQNKTQAHYIARAGAEAVDAIISDLNDDELERLISDLDRGEVAVNDIDINGNKVNVLLNRNEDRLIIESKAKTRDTEDTVTKVLKIVEESISQEIALDYGMFFGENLEITDALEFFNKNKDLIIATSKETFEGEQVIKERVETGLRREYPLLELPDIPTIRNKSYQTNISVLDESTDFQNSNIKFDGLTVDTRDGNVDIIVNTLAFLGNHEIEILGDGEVRIFVKNGIDFSGVNDINKNGDPSRLEIYYYAYSLQLSDNLHIWANIYAYKDSHNRSTIIDVSGNSHITGSIFHSGENGLIRISGNIKGIDGIIYAPQSKVEWSGNGEIDNGIIASDIKISGLPKVYNKGTVNFPWDKLPGGSNSKKIKVQPGYYK